jgi:hypothetical protein
VKRQRGDYSGAVFLDGVLLDIPEQAQMIGSPVSQVAKKNWDFQVTLSSHDISGMQLSTSKCRKSIYVHRLKHSAISIWQV